MDTPGTRGGGQGEDGEGLGYEEEQAGEQAWNKQSLHVDLKLQLLLQVLYHQRYGL